MLGRHFTLDDREKILHGIIENWSLRKIGKSVLSHASTVSRELQKHRVLDEPTPTRHDVPKCIRVSSAPWVCNGCDRFSVCKNLKYRYSPMIAEKAYRKSLLSCRRKIRTGSDGLNHIDKIVTPLIRDHKQTVGHVFSTHSKQLGISRSTFYRYVDANLLTVKNIDLPGRVRYPKIQKRHRSDSHKIDNLKCRKGRDYTSFQAFIQANPNAHIMEMNTVIGKIGQGQKVLLTFLMRKSNFMFAFLRDANTQASVKKIFDELQRKLGYARFKTLFFSTLTDNGSEFKNPEELEHGKFGSQRCHIFYCDSRASQQKGRIEKNHEYIRKFLPQGVSFNQLTQAKVNLMMSHINSIKRDSLGGKSPFECLTRGELKDMKKAWSFYHQT